MEKLRENWLFDRNEVKLLNEQELKEHNITKLQESHSLTEVLDAAEQIRTKLQENDLKVFDSILKSLKETGLSNTFKVWKLPIGKYGNLNGNKRIYPKKLWENVRDKQQDAWKGVCGLCDHPEKDNDPGEFKNQAVLWHDMDIGDNNTVYGYASFIGPFGHLAQEILEHGGRVGTSSSGFGDVDPITKTVDSETYIIERLADLVLNPSQGTFGTAATCTHSAGEFLDDPTKGATIEFKKYQPMKEANNNPRSRIMAENATKFDAANPGGAPTAPIKETAQTGVAPQQQVQELLQETQVKSNLLTKVEEKAFRKYVQSFLNDANKIDNPIQRLNECVDILNCFDEGNCPDLRESLEKQLLEEKDTLEKLVETVVKTESEYEMDITQFREAAERNTAQGLLLKEQVTDYKELCDGLAKRNVQLREENEKYRKMIAVNNKLAEKKIFQSNKTITTTSSEVDRLKEELEKMEERNERLIERVSKLALSNKEFEKENDILTGKIKEAGSIMKQVKQQKLTESQQEADLKKMIEKLQAKLAATQSQLELSEGNYISSVKRYEKLTEDFENYKEEVNLTYNVNAKVMPKFDERVGKYLNFRENKGIEIESYWADLKENYGEAIDPYEDRIRGAKTLKEATSAFLKLRTEIDPNFAVAQPAEYAYRNRAERKALYEHQGIIDPIQLYEESTLEQKNEEFLRKLHENGLQ